MMKTTEHGIEHNEMKNIYLLTWKNNVGGFEGDLDQDRMDDGVNWRLHGISMMKACTVANLIPVHWPELLFGTFSTSDLF